MNNDRPVLDVEYPYRCHCGGLIALVSYRVISTHILAEREEFAYSYNLDAWRRQGTHRHVDDERFHCCTCHQTYTWDEMAESVIEDGPEMRDCDG